jgi:hypothetical protein
MLATCTFDQLKPYFASQIGLKRIKEIKAPECSANWSPNNDPRRGKIIMAPFSSSSSMRLWTWGMHSANAITVANKYQTHGVTWDLNQQLHKGIMGRIPLHHQHTQQQK